MKAKNYISKYSLCTICDHVSSNFYICPNCKSKHPTSSFPRQESVILNGLVKEYLDDIKSITEDFTERDLREVKVRVSIILICTVGEALLDEAIDNKLYREIDKRSEIERRVTMEDMSNMGREKKINLLSSLIGCKFSKFIKNTQNQNLKKIPKYWKDISEYRNRISHGNFIEEQLVDKSKIIQKIQYLNENFFETFMLLHNKYIASSDK